MMAVVFLLGRMAAKIAKRQDVAFFGDGLEEIWYDCCLCKDGFTNGNVELVSVDEPSV